MLSKFFNKKVGLTGVINKKMKVKELKLDFEALVSQLVSEHGFLHYGLWEEEVLPSSYSLQKVAQAQLAYFERMLKEFPSQAKTILDIGSGTGSNALALVNRGYRVDCVCPSPQLNSLARGKLPQESSVFESRYEDFEVHENAYDFAFFAESFHYLDPVLALGNVSRHSKYGALIFDYFPRVPTENRLLYRDFEALVQSETKFRILKSEELTAQIATTFDVLRQLQERHLFPFLQRASRSFREAYPVLSWLPSYIFDKKIAKHIAKPSKAAGFIQTYEYRLITLG